MNIENSKVFNEIYSILNHKGYETPLIHQNKKVQNFIRMMVLDKQISQFYLEKTEKLLKKERIKCQKLQNSQR